MISVVRTRVVGDGSARDARRPNLRGIRFHGWIMLEDLGDSMLVRVWHNARDELSLTGRAIEPITREVEGE